MSLQPLIMLTKTVIQCCFLAKKDRIGAGSCTSKLQLKVNCRKKFGLVCTNSILQFTLSQQFTFSCNSLVHLEFSHQIFIFKMHHFLRAF